MRTRVAITISLALFLLSTSSSGTKPIAWQAIKCRQRKLRCFFQKANFYMLPPDLAQKANHDSAAIFYEKCIACDSY